MTGGLGLMAVAVAGIIYAFPSPNAPPEARISTEKAETVATPKPVAFAPQRKQVVQTAMEFIRTAVSRQHIGDSWDIAAPSLKQGHTKADWASGRDLPVPRYVASLAITRLLYSFKNEVDLKVALFARKDQKRPVVFDITLDRYRIGGQSRWLVSSFLPTPGDGGGLGRGPGPSNIFAAQAPSTPQSARFYLLIPVGILGLLLLLLAALGVRGWHASRIYRAYARGD